MKSTVYILFLVSLFGCAGNLQNTNNTDKSLLEIQTTIVNTHDSFITPCKTKIVPADVCHQVDSLVLQAGGVYDEVIDARISSFQTGDNSNYLVKRTMLDKLVSDLVGLAIKYSTTTGGSK